MDNANEISHDDAVSSRELSGQRFPYDHVTEPAAYWPNANIPQWDTSSNYFPDKSH